MTDTPSLYTYPIISSTMDKAHQLLTRSAPTPFIVSAHRQTQGRGRLHRTWQSLYGNAHITAVYAQQYETLQELIIYTLCVINTLHALSIKQGISIKWPNDIMLNKKKIGGILIEKATHKNRPYFLCGLGLNLVANPTEISYPTTSICEETGLSIHTEDFIKLFTPIITNRHAFINKNLINEWQNLMQPTGTSITLKDGDALHTGIFCGVTNKGELCIQMNQKKHFFSHGDIVMLEK